MITLKAFSDNFIHLCEYESGKVLVVDPGQSEGVLEALETQQQTLTTVLVTHHHWDHVGGVLELKKKTGCEVIGPDASRIKGLDRVVRGGDRVNLGSVTFEVMATSGHSLTSVCYYSDDLQEDGVVFTGDTLFIGGCGRLLEGSPPEMFASLTRLAQLPDLTRVYCGHDYTVDNYEFAQTVEPGNVHVQTQLELARETLQCDSTIGQEKLSNVFVRAGDVLEFALRRKLKDVF